MVIKKININTSAPTQPEIQFTNVSFTSLDIITSVYIKRIRLQTMSLFVIQAEIRKIEKLFKVHDRKELYKVVFIKFFPSVIKFTPGASFVVSCPFVVGYTVDQISISIWFVIFSSDSMASSCLQQCFLNALAFFKSRFRVHHRANFSQNSVQLEYFTKPRLSSTHSR